MQLSTWLLYVIAVVVLTVTPGPTVLMCISNSVQYGARRALLSAAGSTTAIVGLMSLSALGLGAALAASESLFNALKWLGAAYLAYLGLSSIFSKAGPMKFEASSAPRATGFKLFGQGLLVGASNPKALLFFSALFPQFIDPAAPQLPQFAVLCATFVFFESLWLVIYTLLASRAKAWLQAPRRALAFNRLTGAVFLVAAGAVAASRKNPA